MSESERETMRCVIELHSGSVGTVRVSDGHTQLGPWLWVGYDVLRRPLGLVRRIALDWAYDGGDRAYSGEGYRVRPLSTAGELPDRPEEREFR